MLQHFAGTSYIARPALPMQPYTAVFQPRRQRLGSVPKPVIVEALAAPSPCHAPSQTTVMMPLPGARKVPPGTLPKPHKAWP